MNAAWSHTTTKSADIKRSLIYAAQKIVDTIEMERAGYDRQTIFIMSELTYGWLKTWYARANWRELYRAGRLLGNRQLAFDRIGNRRAFPENWRWKIES